MIKQIELSRYWLTADNVLTFVCTVPTFLHVSKNEKLLTHNLLLTHLEQLHALNMHLWSIQCLHINSNTWILVTVCHQCLHINSSTWIIVIVYSRPHQCPHTNCSTQIIQFLQIKTLARESLSLCAVGPISVCTLTLARESLSLCTFDPSGFAL